ncbi:MAG: polyketide antibiotic transporter [Glaciihabitans sp.]
MNPNVRLLLSVLRRDRVQLLLWVLGISLLVLASASAVVNEFDTEEERRLIVAVAAANPAFRFLRASPAGIDVGSVFFFQGFTFIAVLAGLMSTFSVVRNTRAEEDTERAELLAALPLSRRAPLLVALTVAALANLVLAAAIAGVLVLVGLDTTGSVLTGVTVGAVGLTFAGVAAVAAQVMPTARGANGVSAAAVGLSYVVRGIADALGEANDDLTATSTTWLSWFSPIGWGQKVHPFGADDPAPLLICLAAVVVLVGLALGVRSRRDLGASLVRERPGPARASAFGRTAVGLAWRLQLPSLIGWAIGTGVLAAIAGTLAPTVAEAAEENTALSGLLQRLGQGQGGDTLDIFVTAILGVCGVLAAGAGVHAVIRLHAEESSGRLESLLAGSLSRQAWMLGHTVVAVVSVTVVCLVAGAAAGIAFILAGADPDRFGSSLGATLAQIPAALTLVGVVLVVFAVLPRITTALGWGVFVIALIFGQFGELLNLPEWLQDLSPFRHTSALPLEEFEPAPALLLAGIGIVAAGVALVAFRVRDIHLN